MAHITLSVPKGATTFNPIVPSYERDSKDGLIPVINFLLGSHYNARIGGEISISSTGDITGDSLKAVNGKLEIVLDAVTGTVTKTGAFVSFMYFYTGVKVVGQLEVQDDNVGSGPVPIQNVRYTFEDLGTTDKIEIILEGHDGNARIRLRETVDQVATDLVIQPITAGVKVVDFELDFIEDGKTKFFFFEPGGTKTRIFNGDLSADIAECKVNVTATLDQTVPKTLKSDYMWIFYPSTSVTYDVPLATRLLGRCRIFDDKGFPADETKWKEVFSSDVPYTGQRVVENGLIRIIFKTTPEMEILGWDGAAYVTTGSVIPVSSLGDLATTLHDVIFERFTDGHIKIIVKYGLLDHIVEMHRGNPFVRVAANSKKIRVDTDKPRFGLSTDVVTDIPDFNQNNVGDVNRGNPLNLSPTVNPFTFTNDSNINTGLLLLDDNWMAWLDTTKTADVLGWAGCIKRPTGMVLTADSATDLGKIDWTFAEDIIMGFGVLSGDSNTLVNGIPKTLNIGNVDEYVKWRANESVFNFNQKLFLRKKR